MITRSMSRNFLKKRSMDFVYQKPNKKARRALVDYYMEHETPNYAFTFLYVVVLCFTCVIFSYAVILAVV